MVGKIAVIFDGIQEEYLLSFAEFVVVRFVGEVNPLVGSSEIIGCVNICILYLQRRRLGVGIYVV